ncbi:hypothetical protein LS684_11810 [Cytobacillus spongiae]|jgi:hypothetical protein|uniref:hypothetical protein n=1 Tax=Cytobacillus spongiae TaxID=2901381 RepID=UPI001F316ADC|nr:hypothetical protein [Cytobacillus spongiae]UII54367.1 hypothetical protein LS684_11810 [Cytobacillus spongiae]
MSYTTHQSRRQIAYVSITGTTIIHQKDPYIVAFWSALFPGFGHFYLCKYIRATLLTLWVILINTNANINVAIIFSLTGEWEQAKEIINIKWFLLYIPVWLFAIWDSYRTCVSLNTIHTLASRENANFVNFKISALEINYLEKRTPIMSVIWSIFMPGMGYLYIHRVFLSFYTLILWITFIYLSHFLEAVHFLVDGKIEQATSVLNPEWFLFLPIIYGSTIYDSYVYAVENNKLFEKDQFNYLKENYQLATRKIPFPRNMSK